MKGDKRVTRVLGARMIPQLEEGLRASLGLLPGERSLGLITTDCDDASYVALDEATKMAAVRVAYAKSMYAGAKNASTALAGEFIGVLAGPSPSEVRSGMEAALGYLAEGCCFYSADDGDSVVYFAHCIPRSGSYLSAQCGIREGAPLAYLIAPPMEAILGLDAALKAADVALARFYGPPTETNFAGGLLTGDEAACRAACRAFAAMVEDAAASPACMR